MMDELSDLCRETPFDLEAYYLRLRSLVTTYVTFYAGDEEHPWVDEVVDEITCRLIYDRKLHLKEHSGRTFWWIYIGRVVSTYWEEVVRKHERIFESAELLHSPYSPFELGSEDRSWHRLTKRRIGVLLRSGEVFSLVDSLKEINPALAEGLDKQLSSFLAHGDTKVLLSAYKRLVQSYTKELKACQSKILEKVHRVPPSKRRALTRTRE